MADFLTINIYPKEELKQVIPYGELNSTIYGIDFKLPDSGMLADGIVQVIQLFVKYLLTRKGSNLFNPEEGTYLLDYIGGNITSQSIREIYYEVNEAINYFLPKLSEIQQSNVGNYENEAVVEGIYLKDVNYVIAEGSINIIVEFITGLGTIPIVISS